MNNSSLNGEQEQEGAVNPDARLVLAGSCISSTQGLGAEGLKRWPQRQGAMELQGVVAAGGTKVAACGFSCFSTNLAHGHACPESLFTHGGRRSREFQVSLHLSLHS